CEFQDRNWSRCIQQIIRSTSYRGLRRAVRQFLVEDPKAPKSRATLRLLPRSELTADVQKPAKIANRTEVSTWLPTLCCWHRSYYRPFPCSSLLCICPSSLRISAAD